MNQKLSGRQRYVELVESRTPNSKPGEGPPPTGWKNNALGYKWREITGVGEDGPIPMFECRDPKTGLKATRESYGEAVGALRDQVTAYLEARRFPWKAKGGS